MGTGKHRAPKPNRPKVGSIVAAGTVPLILALVGTGTANAEPDRSVPVNRFDFGALSGAAAQWPGAEAPNVRPYEGVRIPDDTLSSLQWARPLPAHEYLAPLIGLHAPAPVAPVPPIAPPPGKLRFGDVQVDAPEWLYREQAIQINDSAAMAEADMATFLDSVGMERTRSDRVASQTMGAAAIGAAAGFVFASPFALFGAAVGGGLGLAIGLPFAPIGLAAGPIGAAYGAALMAAPLSAIGAGIGAGLGAVHALSAPPRALSAPESVAPGQEATEPAPEGTDTAPEASEAADG
ncbi:MULTISPECIES: hypothetical protein [Nocardia]|uniref:hypothetical protein n=1 Tax=Nocardia TaxID=1817 RepID=UPI001E4FF36C|nr:MULTISPECIES: hypothetical protein [Nocardia]MDE1673973.1 hypothetical protein [Nocardia gipuzkoensis]